MFYGGNTCCCVSFLRDPGGFDLLTATTATVLRGQEGEGPGIRSGGERWTSLVVIDC